MTERQIKYAELLQRCRGLVEGESDRIANAANVVAEVHRTMGFLWTGIYRVIGEDLVLGPFQGPVACTRIHKGKGVCGSSWAREESILVPDVNAFPGHIRCSGDARSEIVIPIWNGGRISGVFDIDCDTIGGLDGEDLSQLTAIVNGCLSDAAPDPLG